jgi:hypothetical protein
MKNSTSRLALAAAACALSIDVASAETVQLLCPYSGGSGNGDLVTIDYDAQTLGIDFIDPAGNVTISAYHRMPAKISDDAISAIVHEGRGYARYTLNRYSAVLHSEARGDSHMDNYSSPCTPYQRGAKKF